MGADLQSTATPADTLAMILAAIGELESEAMVAKRGTRPPTVAGVQQRLEQFDVHLERARIVETLQVAIGDLGLATGVSAVDEAGQPDLRSLHVTMSGVRWLRDAIRRQHRIEPG